MSKVEKKRNRHIEEAVANDNWNEVSHLLDQPMENSLRKDRHYGTLSMNNKVSNTGEQKEHIDNIADTNPDPLEQLIINEEEQYLEHAMSLLSKQEQLLILGYYFDSKSYAHLAKELGISDKTVKKRLQSTLEKMKTILQENF